MAGRGISINILANVRDALNGTGDVEKALSDIEATLDDMQRSGDDSVDKMSRGFRDLARDADTSADKIERNYKRAFRDTARAADDSADEALRAQRRLGEQSEEVGQEIRQNLGEGLANAARGDFEGLADVIGDTLGGATAGIGGIQFAAAGAAGALGIGALVAAFQLAEEERKKLEERANDLATAYIDAGTNVLDTMTIVARMNAILADPTQRQEAEALRDALGVDLSTAVRALAGDTNALAIANKIASDSQEEYLNLATRQSQGYTELSSKEAERLGQLKDQKKAIDDLNTAQGIANEIFETSQQGLQDMINDAEGATVKIDDLGNKLYELPDGAKIVVDAETGQASTNVDNFKGEIDEIDGKVVRSKVVFDVDDYNVRVYRPPVKFGDVRYSPSGRPMT